MPTHDDTGNVNESLLFTSGDEPDPPMTLADLFAQCKVALEQGANPDMPVLCRVTDCNGDDVMGGLTAAHVDAGCTDVDAFIIDGHEDVGGAQLLDSHDEDESGDGEDDELPVVLLDDDEDLPS
jgi:hypothetical protein